MQKDSKQVQLGFRSYQLFYKIGTNSKTEKTYADFASSAYYSAFVKFGTYCLDLRVDDVPAFTKWLLQNSIKLDKWASDTNFSKWIKERLKSESVDRAVERTVLFMHEQASASDTPWNEYFETVPTNLAVFHICSGKISPWVLYASSRAQNLLDRMNDEQIKLVIDYIDPVYWQIHMKRKSEDFAWVKTLLTQAQLQ
jgi:hypothetical protein